MTPEATPARLSTRQAETDMVRRVREFPWERTPLGAMASWPQSLRIAVGICMNSRFPMFVWWGPQLVNIYNDAYVPVLGNKHPEALGRPAQESWQEIWDVVGAQARAVMERGESTWNERVLLKMLRRGYAEDTYFTWSYSPIYDEAGRVGGLFCACTEETGRVLAERERDRLIDQVQAERARLAQAFEQSPSFLAVLEGPEMVFEFANERYYELVGRHDLLGRKVREALPEIERQGFFEILDRVYRTGEPFVGENMAVQIQRSGAPDLDTAYVDFVYLPTRSADGQVTGILAHGVDVTDRYLTEARDRFLLQVEDALRPLSDPRDIASRSATLLAEHLKADRCAYADIDIDQRSFEVAGDYARGVPSMVGHYRLEDFGREQVRTLQEGLPYVVRDIEVLRPGPEDLAPYRAAQIRALVAVPMIKAGRLVGGMAVHQKTPRRWTRWDVELIQHVASRCYESFERARVERTLRHSEARFRQLADAMPQMVFVTDAGGRVVYFNRQWYEYTGLTAERVSEALWRDTVAAEDRAIVDHAWPEALRTGEPYEIECRIRRNDGANRWHLVRAVPVRRDSGRIDRWFGTSTDIDDRKRIEVALGKALEAEQLAREDAERASRMKDEFLATLSHELRTPLNAILGWSHMIRGPNVAPEQLRHGAEVIERNARAQSTIIEDLLDMSAIISGKVRIELRAQDLAPLVRSAVETARPTAQAKAIALDSRLEAIEKSRVNADADRLQQVLWNLLSNAIKFTPQGGRIEIEARRLDRAVEIVVADTGPGIAPDFLPYIFDRFRQADASTTRKHGGLGLGLSIVKQLVELHGGAVRAENRPGGQGARFTLVLPESMPTSRKAAGTAHAPGTLQIPMEDRARVANLRVLAVDDEPDARDLLKSLLEACGATVTTAGSSREALVLLKERPYDVLVSDIGMPGEDGYSLMTRLRTMQGTPNAAIPAVALTAYARAEDRVKALHSGFQMHAAKPLDPAELVAIVALLGAPREPGRPAFP